MGHTLVIIPTKGASTAMKEGAVSADGKVDEVEMDIIDQADHTWIYSNSPSLLKRIETRYPDLHDRDDVLVITPERLIEWLEAVRDVAHRPRQ